MNVRVFLNVMVLILLLLTLVAFLNMVAVRRASGQQYDFRDSKGRPAGTVTVTRNYSYFRDSRGRITMQWGPPSGNQTIYRDSRGRVIGTQTKTGRR